MQFGNRNGVNGIIGIGFDGIDGHKRLTRGKNILVAGGSEETHAFLSEIAIRVDEKLSKKGRVSDNEFHDTLRDVLSDVGER